MAIVTDIESIDQFNELISNAPKDALVALNFHAPWAAPCKQMNQFAPSPPSAPSTTPQWMDQTDRHPHTACRVFQELAEQATPHSALFVSIDAEEYPDISESYDVAAVPFFVLLKQRVVVAKLSGSDPAALAQEIQKHIGAAAPFALPPAQQTSAPSSTTTATAAPGTAATGTGAAEANGTVPPAAAVGDGEGVVQVEELNTRLGKLVRAAHVMLFMKGTPAAPQCGFSRQLVSLLRERGVRYGFFNILADDEVRQGLKAFSDWPTYPQLYVDGELIGGLDIVREEFENDENFLKPTS